MKAERPKLQSYFKELRDLSRNESTERVDTLEELINGFYIMISEVEVETSVIHYDRDIRDAIEVLSAIRNDI
uniref:Histidine kinase n=1 Tax=Caenorhabditis tropicalis TaxID=1561998 RepID=A0A1I7SZP0_9PELO